eukprot:6191016-Pleurochrysis_carterae.AAC.2
MADAFKQLAERREAPSPPSLRFKYGPLDVKVTHWNRPRSASRAKDSAAWEARTFSLRPDRCAPHASRVDLVPSSCCGLCSVPRDTAVLLAVRGRRSCCFDHLQGGLIEC